MAMSKAKKRLSKALAAVFTAFTLLSFVPASAAPVAKPTVLTVSQQPAAEYKVGDRITFKVKSNYGGAVEYRVILWNGTTKTQKELWAGTPGYYYQNWKPSGTFEFPITWVVTEDMQPGAYSLTVLTRKAGTKASYDAFNKLNTFWVVKDAPVAEATVVSVANPADATVNEGDAYTLPTTVEATMSDNTKKQVAVAWDKTVDTKVVGDVTVTGKAADKAVSMKVSVKEVALKVDSVSAIGAKKLEVKFNKAVDTAKAVVSVAKGTISVNADKVEFAADKKSAVITTTTNLSKGEYTVTVSGATTTAISGKVTVEDVKVSKINITSPTAPRLAGNKTAKVAYQILNQYGEKMTGQSITWTVSTGEVATLNDNTTVDGSFVITAANGADFIPGATVYITGVHATSGTVVNTEVKIGLAAQADSVVFKGVYNVDKDKLESLPAGFADEKYVLLYSVIDQYGNEIADPTFSELVFTSNNPLFVSNTFEEGSEVEIDDVTYQAVELDRGSSVDKGGSVTVQAISTLTGKIATYKMEAQAVAAVKTFTMAAPSGIVAETDEVEIPFTALDQYGNAITKYDDLFGKVQIPEDKLAFEEQNDGSAKLIFTAPATGASENTDLPVYLTSLVTDGGNFSSLMVNVKDEAVPTAIVGVDAAKVTSIAAGNSVAIKAKDLIVQDQYGRTIKDADVETWITVANNRIVLKSVFTAKSPFTVAAEDVEVVSITTKDESFTISAKGKDVTGLDSTEKLVFSLSTEVDGDGAPIAIASSAKSVTFTKVDQSAYVSYEVENLGTMYNNATANTSADAKYNKTLKVYGVLANGTKVVLPAGDYSVTTDGELDVDGNVITDLAGVDAGGYEVADFGTGDDYKDVKVSVLVTVNDANGAAAAIVEKELLVSNKTPKVVAVAFDSDLVTDGKSTIKHAAGTITADDLVAVIDATEVLDQYGVEVVEAPAITITKLVKVEGSELAVTNNAKDNVSIANAEMGDKFTATFKYASGKTVTVDFTVGLAK